MSTAKKLLLFFLVLTVLSCKQEKTDSILIQNTGEALGTTYSIQYESSVNLEEDLIEVFNIVNQSMSTYIATSDISRINQGDTSVVVDVHFVNVFEASKEIWKKSNGYFDPTVGPLVNAYGFGPNGKMKGIDSTEIDSIRLFVGLEKVALTSTNHIIKEDIRTFIDFNAIAKGYTIDLLGKVLEENNIENYLIELGGELLAKGRNNQSDNSWIVAVDDPTQLEERTLIKTLRLENRGMATSGNYRKTRIDPQTGAKYVHSINPKTGWPKKSNILSVSVLAETCMKADGYATAFMVMDLDETKTILQKEISLDAYIIYVDEEGILQEYLTDGFAKVIVE